MNNLQYNILLKLSDKTHGKRALSNENLEQLTSTLEQKCKYLNCHLALEKSDTAILFETIYDVLKVKLSDIEIDEILNGYTNLLLADARDGYLVDKSWIIDHLWYLCMGNIKEKDKYKDCITYIQNRLLTAFSIKENTTSKIKRNVITNFYINA